MPARSNGSKGSVRRAWLISPCTDVLSSIGAKALLVTRFPPAPSSSNLRNHLVSVPILVAHLVSLPHGIITITTTFDMPGGNSHSLNTGKLSPPVLNWPQNQTCR